LLNINNQQISLTYHKFFFLLYLIFYFLQFKMLISIKFKQNLHYYFFLKDMLISNFLIHPFNIFIYQKYIKYLLFNLFLAIFELNLIFLLIQ